MGAPESVWCWAEHREGTGGWKAWSWRDCWLHGVLSLGREGLEAGWGAPRLKSQLQNEGNGLFSASTTWQTGAGASTAVEEIQDGPELTVPEGRMGPGAVPRSWPSLPFLGAFL